MTKPKIHRILAVASLVCDRATPFSFDSQQCQGGQSDGDDRMLFRGRSGRLDKFFNLLLAGALGKWQLHFMTSCSNYAHKDAEAEMGQTP
jgi:hypothetical protein